MLLIAWRTEVAFAPAIGDHAARAPFLIFGLASVLIAAPFLIRPLAWKRLLAYSSLEHMGVIAVGIGAGNRLALIGAALHVVAHAIVKASRSWRRSRSCAPSPTPTAPTGRLARTGPRLGALLELCLVALAGLPPSPLFASELLILLGGLQAGEPWVAAVAAALLALAFVGLAQAPSTPSRRARRRTGPGAAVAGRGRLDRRRRRGARSRRTARRGGLPAGIAGGRRAAGWLA